MNEADWMETKFLVDAARGGDAAAQNQLLQRHLPALRAYVRLNSGPQLRARESCSDVVQSVCLGALNNLEGFEWRGRASFKHWLFSWAINKIRNHERFHISQKRDINRELHADSETAEQMLAQCYATISSPSKAMMLQESIEEIEHAFDSLSDDYRNVILDVRLMGLSVKDVASRDGKSETAVRSMLSRALARLATLLEKD
jgi:RNA polymerase sigma-70 factor, ECF subfamily